jgi:hypothetical protein
VAARVSVCSAAKPVKRQTRTNRAFARRIASLSSARFSLVGSFVIDCILWVFFLRFDVR